MKFFRLVRAYLDFEVRCSSSAYRARISKCQRDRNMDRTGSVEYESVVPYRRIVAV
jgi:hypothetical protein